MNECACLWIRISTLVSSLASLLDSLGWRLCRGLSFNGSWNTHKISLLYSTYTVEFSIWNYAALKWTSLHLIALFWADCISHSISFSTCFLSLECTGSALFTQIVSQTWSTFISVHSWMDTMILWTRFVCNIHATSSSSSSWSIYFVRGIWLEFMSGYLIC